VNAAERVARALAHELSDLNPALLARRPPFRAALAGALAVMPEEEIVPQILALGGMIGARSPYAVVIARLRELPAIAADRGRFADEDAEARRWAAVDRAAKRGESLRLLVDAGTIFADEAAHLAASEFPDDDLRAIAEAALGGVT
jgi:hypothetical protein